jgi:hypothetical protein
MEKTVLMKFLEILVDNVLRYNYSMMQIEKKLWENVGDTQAYNLKWVMTY